VAIYNGAGQVDGSLATGDAPQLLATIPDPFSLAAGPLDVALGDFTGGGVSELAISAKNSNQISVWTFQLPESASTNGPLNAPVTPVSMGSPFTPAGLQNAKGINLAAVSLTNNGVYQLVATAATNGTGKVFMLSYGAQNGWQVTQTITGVPVKGNQGLSVSAGNMTNDGMADIVVGSQANGKVAVYSEDLKRWAWSIAPLGTNAKNVRVAIDSSEGASGSIVVTSVRSGVQAAIVAWHGKAQKFQLPSSPGSGALVPIGAGYAYSPSTIVTSAPTSDDSATFDYSPGPATPVVLFAATGGSQLVIQDFQSASTHGSSVAQFAPNTADTFVEPLWGSQGQGFIPLQVTSDPDATGQSASTNALVPSINLVVLPKNDYISPFSIDLSGVPASVTAGLVPITPLISSTTNPWGPAAVINTPPTVNSQTTTLSLQQRVIAAYASFLGVDYQHHHNPLWQPSQKDPWNVTGTLAYQSQGIDCTNFTAAAYADALGIQMSGDTTTQSLIGTGDTILNGQTAPNKSYITLPKNADGTASSVDSWINVQTYNSSAWGNTYQGLVNFLQPGDILYIKGKPNGNVTHAITWLGQFGVDSNGKYQHLIIDSTGITPQHVDSNNRIIPEGVHIRPFADGDGKTPNTWYFADVDHVMRIIGNGPT
jgi:cell wall-associated NlpC family hydrolase